MKPNSSHDQEWYLYNYNWNFVKDNYLINRLVEREDECKLVPTPADSPHALICAMEALNKEMAADMTYSDVLERVKFLRMRYNCFKKLTSRVETVWDVPNNRVTADDKVWDVIFRDDPFTRAYYKQGDPLWFRLCRLFGYNSIKQELSPTVIIISDSPSAARPHVLNAYNNLSDDEATSPVLKEPTARKLVFVDDAESSIGPNAAPTNHLYYVWPPIERRLAIPPANAFPRMPEIGKGKAKSTEHSSCASSSPFN